VGGYQQGGARCGGGNGGMEASIHGRRVNGEWRGEMEEVDWEVD
jgi:hypothetical protein